MRFPKIGCLAVLFATSAACGGHALQGAGTGGTAGAAGGGGTDGGLEPPQKANVDAVWPGAGCGQALPTQQVQTVPGSPKGYTHLTVMGTGANLTDTPIALKAGPRTFWVRVPADYDPNRPYRVVFVGQGCGGYQIANTATYQLFKEPVGGTEQAIYVALDIPQDMANMDCYDNRDGVESQEWEAFGLFMAFVDAHYCVDLNKIYVAGYSTGAWLANMWGCYFSGWPDPPRKFAPRYHIRAQASYSGAEPDNQPACGGPVAGFWLHDAEDTANPIGGSLAALARVGAMNGCDTNRANASLQVAWHAEDPRIGNVCRKFVGCPADYPVVFCETVGRAKSSQEQLMIPALKYFFDEVETGVTAVNKCVPACALGDSTCGPGGGLRGCTLDASGCPVISEELPCGPGFTCCPTCGLGSVPGIAGCAPNPGCAAVSDACRSPGTFCLDENTVATCALSYATTPSCLTVTDPAPCAANQKCVAYPSGHCE
jgi:poly(3-hydroxybutyrate) depolymerase